MSHKASVLIVLAAAVVTLAALDINENLVSTTPAGVPLEERKGGSWSLPAAAASSPVCPVKALRKRDAERFRSRFAGLTDAELAQSELFGSINVNGRLIKQLVENEAAALEALHDFTSSRDGARSTWQARGYRFRYRNVGEVWSLVAAPLTQYRTGVRSFYVDETGVFRVSLNEATSSSSAVGDHENWTCDGELVKRVARLAVL